ncbi:P-loop containing nucleoside triphosphate hydrolase protein [Mycena galopus ATCC 62051]|nr:P-loop containing nucleoside triphosphate hydrolase protein [Mycena galopus ATCC 62051]
MLHEMFAMTKQLLGTVHDLRADVDSLSPDDSLACTWTLTAMRVNQNWLRARRPLRCQSSVLWKNDSWNYRRSLKHRSTDMDVERHRGLIKGRAVQWSPDTPNQISHIWARVLAAHHGEEFDRALESSYGDSGVSQASILEMIQSDRTRGTSPTDSSFDLFDYPPDTSFDASFDFESTDQKEVIEISDDEEDVKPIIHATKSRVIEASSSQASSSKHRHESSAPAASSSKSGLFDRPTAAASSKHAGVAPEPKGSAGVPPPVASSSKGQALPHNTHDLLQCLKRLYGPTAHWKSVEQLAAVKALLSLETDVIIRLPTGAGKTAAAVLPTMVEHGVTVIILPLIALIEDWERRLKGLGIRYERFAGRGNIELKGDSNIILVTSDMAKRPAWKTAISALNERRPVLRTIVDEAQYYAMDYNFREDALDNAFQLRILPHQIALMSATIPDAMEKYLVDQFELTNYQCISASIHRPELQLVIEDLGQDRCDLLSTVRRIIAEETSSDSFLASSKNRFIIYVTTIEDGEYLKKELGLPFYHAHSTQHPISDHDRQHIYGGWVDGVYIGFIATNSMGAGNDYPKVRFTIFFRNSFSLTLEEQQAGRAGRDGQHATNYLVCMGGGWRPSKSTEHPKYGDIPGRQALYDLIHKTHPNHPQSCYQHQITGFFDGEGNARTCAELGRERVCQPCAAGVHLPSATASIEAGPSDSLFWSARPEAGLKRKLAEAFGDSTLNANKRTGALIVAKSDRLAVFKRLFDLVGKACGYCVARRVPNPESHPPRTCPNMSSEQRLEFWESGPCFKCHICSYGHDSLHREFVRGKDTCDHRHLVLGLAYGIWTIQELCF